MPEFEVNGISLEVPQEFLTKTLIARLKGGQYEHLERQAVVRFLHPEDRVLDLGAGAGYLSITAARIVGAQNVTSVEAIPDMIPVIRRNFQANDVAQITLLNGAVVADDFPDDSVEFSVSRAFWASAIAKDGRGRSSRQVAVPALRLAAVFEQAQPTFLTMDIEGAEEALTQQDWPDAVRICVMEVHPELYSIRTIKKIMDGMSDKGFTMMPWGTYGKVITFQRVTDEDPLD